MNERKYLWEYNDPEFGFFTNACEGSGVRGSIDVAGKKLAVCLLVEYETSMQTLRNLYPLLENLIKDSIFHAGERLVYCINEEMTEQGLSHVVSKDELTAVMDPTLLLLFPDNFQLFFSKGDILPEIAISSSGNIEQGLRTIALDYVEEILLYEKNDDTN